MTQQRYKVEVEVRKPEDWEVGMSCNGCHRSHSVHREDPPILVVLRIGSRSLDNIGGGGAEFRFCASCWHDVKERIAMGVQP